MADTWLYVVYDNQTKVYAAPLDGPVELGRQNLDEEPPYAHRRVGDHWRMIIASLQEQQLSRKHIRVDPLPGERLKIVNLSDKKEIALGDQRLDPGQTWEGSGPVCINLGPRSVHVQAEDLDIASLQTLALATRPPQLRGAFLSAQLPRAPLQPNSQAEGLIRYLQEMVEVLQSAALSQDFLHRAARALVDLIGLDAGGVLLRPRQQWRQAAYCAADGAGREETEWRPSRMVLERILAERRTFWQLPSTQGVGSLLGVKAVAASPILNPDGEVVGVLYGERRQVQLKPLTKVDALLVELLANCVAAGLARLAQEEEALRHRVKFEQFFTAELARQLENQPELLKPRAGEVTVLVCDVRGFSRITERLGPDRTIPWLNDVLAVLTGIVLHHSGVLVDYAGDSLLAMWGAPSEQPDHAALACQAALAMFAQLDGLNRRWQDRLGEPVDLSIGIDSGPVQVGNIGCELKFKYGCLGNTPNLASRLQGANKYLQTRLLISGNTRHHLDERFATRRLCQVRVINIAQPVDLYELAPPDRPGWAELKKGYEWALGRFEKKDFPAAIRSLGNILTAFPDDGPTLALLSRFLQQGLPGSVAPDAVWDLPSK